MSGDIETDFVYNLIKSVEGYKCLYNKRDPNYYNKGAKERTWKVVADMCNKSVDDCKHRWKLLRERFVKELKKMEAPSGSGMYFQDEWRFLQPMLFLKSSLAPRRTRDNVDEGNETQASILSDECIEDSSPYPIEPTAPKNRKVAWDGLCNQFSDVISQFKDRLSTPVQAETADELFMKTSLRLLDGLALDVKEELQANFINELVRARRECRNAKNNT